MCLRPLPPNLKDLKTFGAITPMTVTSDGEEISPPVGDVVQAATRHELIPHDLPRHRCIRDDNPLFATVEPSKMRCARGEVIEKMGGINTIEIVTTGPPSPAKAT